MDSGKSSQQKFPSNYDEESNSEIKINKKFFNKWIIIGLFTFFVFIFFVLITALCLVFIEVISVQQQQQPESTTNVNNVYQFEDLLHPVQVPTEDQVIPKQLADFSTLIQQPKDQQVELGKEAILDCKFEHKVHCRWLRRSNLVDISSRYSYIEPELEDGNVDCSIKITAIKNMDLGDWQCVGIFNDQSSLSSNSVNLQKFQAQEQTMEILPKDVTAEMGDDVQLDCKFNQKVNCAWMRRGEHIEIQGRYKFMEKSDESDERLSDCSIIIEKVKKIDAGEWICSSMADSNSAGLTSSPITLTLIT